MAFRVLIIGGTGQVGAAVVRALVSQPSCAEIVMVNRKTIPLTANHRVRQVILDTAAAVFPAEVTTLAMSMVALGDPVYGASCVGVGKGSNAWSEEELKALETKTPFPHYWAVMFLAAVASNPERGVGDQNDHRRRRQLHVLSGPAGPVPPDYRGPRLPTEVRDRLPGRSRFPGSIHARKRAHPRAHRKFEEPMPPSRNPHPKGPILVLDYLSETRSAIRKRVFTAAGLPSGARDPAAL